MVAPGDIQETSEVKAKMICFIKQEGRELR